MHNFLNILVRVPFLIMRNDFARLHAMFRVLLDQTLNLFGAVEANHGVAGEGIGGEVGQDDREGGGQHEQLAGRDGQPGDGAGPGRSSQQRRGGQEQGQPRHVGL